MDQKVQPLEPGDSANLEAKRAWVRDHYDEAAREQYQTLEGKLRLLETILRNNWIRPDETLKLQCLGIAFGDALAQKLGLQWVAVEDESGRDPALTLPGSSLLLFPMTSISKRIERGEDVDLRALFDTACETVRKTASAGGV